MTFPTFTLKNNTNSLRPYHHRKKSLKRIISNQSSTCEYCKSHGKYSPMHGEVKVLSSLLQLTILENTIKTREEYVG